MPNKLFKKGLVVGIIILFVGVGVQPAISNEVSLPKISDSEEDCDCNIPIGRIQLAEKLLSKAENYLETKDLINTDNLPYERPICNLLASIGIHYAALFIKYDELWRNTPYGAPNYWLYVQLTLTYMAIVIYLGTVGVLLLCWEAPPFPPGPYY